MEGVKHDEDEAIIAHMAQKELFAVREQLKALQHREKELLSQIAQQAAANAKSPRKKASFDTVVNELLGLNPHLTRDKLVKGIKLDREDPCKIVGNLPWYDKGIVELPDSVSSLTVLGSVDLCNNQLTSLPWSFGELTCGGKLDLSHNQLTSLPESFGMLKASRDSHKKRRPRLNHIEALETGKTTAAEFDAMFGLGKALAVLKDPTKPKAEAAQLTGTLDDSKESIRGSLNLASNALQSLPEGFGSLRIGGNLILKNNPELRSLPESFAALHVERDLDLSNNHQLQSLPLSFWREPARGTVIALLTPTPSTVIALLTPTPTLSGVLEPDMAVGGKLLGVDHLIKQAQHEARLAQETREESRAAAITRVLDDADLRATREESRHQKLRPKDASRSPGASPGASPGRSGSPCRPTSSLRHRDELMEARIHPTGAASTRHGTEWASTFALKYGVGRHPAARRFSVG